MMNRLYEEMQDAISDILDTIDDPGLYVGTLRVLRTWITATIEAAENDIRQNNRWTVK